MRSSAVLLIHNIIPKCDYLRIVLYSIDVLYLQHYIFLLPFILHATHLWRAKNRIQIIFEFIIMKVDLQLSKNFRLSEFVRSATASNNNIHQQFIIDFNVLINLTYLANNLLQPLREIVGPINITSGYRCTEVNIIVGGSATSQHLYGQAVDFVCNDFSKAILFIKNRTFDQLIIYDTFIHVSLTTSNNRTQVIDSRTYQ